MRKAMSSAFRGARILLRAEAREAYGMVISEIRKENLRALIRECPATDSVVRTEIKPGRP